MDFKELDLIAPILKALQQEHYEAPSPIQERAIPPALLGRDVLGCAQTGTGKTAAFAVPILQRLNAQPPTPKGQRRPIRSLILTPTRELAIQIGESLQAYGRYLSLRSMVIFGGVSQVPQVSSLKNGVDILVATPGRLNDLIQQGFIDLGSVQIFVLDEADRMLDMGFIHDVKRVLSHLPQKKQTLFFSATMPPEITELVDSLLVDPCKVAVAPVSSTVEAIDQSVYFVDKNNKPKLLIDLLHSSKIESALVFTRTKHGADRVVRELTRAKIKAQAIHGNKSQSARQQALNNFKSREIRVLVATDIAARGIDIDELSHVINYDLPNIPETYVHRIGRTGRAGLDGTAISFCNIDEKPYLKDIEKLIGKSVPVVENHPYPMEIFTLTPPKQQTGRPQRAPHPQQREKQRKEGAQAEHRERPSQPSAQKSAKNPDARGGKSRRGRGAQSEQKRQPDAKQDGKRDVKYDAKHDTRRDTKRDTKPAEQRAAKDPAAAKQHHGGRKSVQPAPQGAGAERAQEKPARGEQGKRKDYLTTLAPRKKDEPPRPLLTRAQGAKKPADQFLSDKPYFRKG